MACRASIRTTTRSNLKLLDEYARIAQDAGCSMAQLSIAWVLSRGEHVIALPGTTSLAHLEENLGADAVSLSPTTLQRLDALINRTDGGGCALQPGHAGRGGHRGILRLIRRRPSCPCIFSGWKSS